MNVSINVAPIDPDDIEKDKVRRRHIHAIREYLRNRFYVQSTSGGVSKFYDTETGRKGIELAAIRDLALHHIPKSVSPICVATPEQFKNEVTRGLVWRQLAPGDLYRPWEPPVVYDQGLCLVNTWQEPDVVVEEIRAPKIEPFIEFLEAALGNWERVRILLALLAWAYQYKGGRGLKKPHIACYFFHQEGGQGKTLFINIIRRVFGERNAPVVNTVDKLGSMSAVELWERSILFVDDAEVTRGGKVYDNLKANIGSDLVTADKKFREFSEHEIPAILIMMSNRPPQFIEEYDRRFFVSKWHLDMEKEERERKIGALIEWLDDGGYEEIANYLSACPPVPPLEAPMTSEKEIAIGMVSDPVVDLIKEKLEEKPDKWLWKMDEFGLIWDSEHVKSSRRKHMLLEAGLTPQGRMRLNGKQPNLWSIPDAVVLRPTGRAVTCSLGDEERSVEDAFSDSDQRLPLPFGGSSPPDFETLLQETDAVCS